MIHVWALLAIFLVLAASLALHVWADDGRTFFAEMIAPLISFAGIIASLICAVIYFGMVYSWFAAEQKANILKREYGVEYSQAEMFFASDVINTVRELDRRRIEINGDFRRQRDPERDLPKPDNR